MCVKMGYENEVPFGTEIEINSSGATAKHKSNVVVKKVSGYIVIEMMKNYV